MIGEQLKISYPSGNTVKIFGIFIRHGPIDNFSNSSYGVAIEALKSTTIAGQEVSAGSIVMLDPRALIVGNKSGIFYNPRIHFMKFGAEMKNWMMVNPHWPNKELLIGIF